MKLYRKKEGGLLQSIWLLIRYYNKWWSQEPKGSWRMSSEEFTPICNRMNIIKSFVIAGASELADCKNYGNFWQLSINYKIRQTAVKERHRILHPDSDHPWTLSQFCFFDSTHLVSAAAWWWCTATCLSREQQRQHYCFTPCHLCQRGR